MATEPLTVLELEQWLGEAPGCEVVPSGISDATCGDPPAGYVLCEVVHGYECMRPLSAFMIWMCQFHQKKAEAGELYCAGCGSIVKVIGIR